MNAHDNNNSSPDPTVRKQEQIHALSTITDEQLVISVGAGHGVGRVSFIRKAFSPEYEEAIRELTHPYGRNNAAYNPEEAANEKPQDHLAKVWGWFYGNTGFSAMFLWASGRQDAHVILDDSNATPEQIQVQRDQIAAFQNGGNYALTIH